MEILWLLIPMSTVLVLVIVGVFGWALHKGQFEDIEHEGARILQADVSPVDVHQVPHLGIPEESPQSSSGHS